jgi:hypothetical protein
MPVLLWTIVCEELQDLGETISLRHVFCRVGAKSFPAKVEKFSVVSAFDGELGEEFDYRVNVQTPTGKLYGPSMETMRLVMRRVPEIASADFDDLVFFEYGVYILEIEINGNPTHLVNLRITK